MKKISRFIPFIMVALAAAFPLVVQNSYYQNIIILIFIWTIIGSAWNVIAGYTGQVSFGNAVFFGVGAYTAGLIALNFGISMWWGLFLGGVAAIMISFPMGWLTFPLRGAYFALSTLALGEIARFLATNMVSFTGGMGGVQIMPSFVSKLPYYYIALGLVIFTIVFIQVIMKSKWGYYFLSIREDQDAAESLGINSDFYKMNAFNISAFFTGVAGAMFMNYMGFIDPEVVFNLTDISIMAILVAIVGGVGTSYGPIVGAIIMVSINEFFRTGFFGFFTFLADTTGQSFFLIVNKYVSHAHVLGFGVLVVLVILYLPNGVVGDWKKITGFFVKKRTSSKEEAI
jgi:branched-chain amino acid transport system permease protein